MLFGIATSDDSCSQDRIRRGEAGCDGHGGEKVESRNECEYEDGANDPAEDHDGYEEKEERFPVLADIGFG